MSIDNFEIDTSVEDVNCAICQKNIPNNVLKVRYTANIERYPKRFRYYYHIGCIYPKIEAFYHLLKQKTGRSND